MTDKRQILINQIIELSGVEGAELVHTDPFDETEMVLIVRFDPNEVKEILSDNSN